METEDVIVKKKKVKPLQGPTAKLCRLFEQTLEHGGGVRGPRLFVLDRLLKVLNSVAAFPDFFKLSGQDLGPPLPGQSCLL